MIVSWAAWTVMARAASAGKVVFLASKRPNVGCNLDFLTSTSGFELLNDQEAID